MRQTSRTRQLQRRLLHPREWTLSVLQWICVLQQWLVAIR